MNKFYILMPLLACLVFGGFYYKFSQDFSARKAREDEQTQAEIKEKQIRDTEARQAAYQAAIEAQAQRKKEREERERIESERRQARFDLEDKRQEVFDERRRLREEVERAEKDIAAVNAEIEKLQVEHKARMAEIDFLRDYVARSTAGVQRYVDLLDKINAAEKAAELAAASAAAAPKK